MHEHALDANRANWEDRTEIHLASHFYDVDGWLAESRGPRPWEHEILGDVTGNTLLHLQCHIGLGTLAWARSGARVTGLDFSPSAISAARDIARRAGLAERARFVCADVQDAVDALDGEAFDVVYVSLGALCWLPSVEAWARQVGQLVRPRGRFFLHDVHPVVQAAAAEDRLELVNTYFEHPDPQMCDSEVTYTDGQGRLAHPRSYQWNHGLGEIVTALLDHGLRLEHLAEHDWMPWRRFAFLVEDQHGRWRAPSNRPRLPLTFSLLATKAV